MESRVETLLNALINGETIDFEPQSRMEEYLKNCINKTGVEDLPTPQSRVDALLYKLAEVIASSGGGSTSVVGYWLFKDTITIPEEMWDKSFYFKFAVSTISHKNVLLNEMRFGDDGTALSFNDYDGYYYYDFEDIYCEGWLSTFYRVIEVIEEPPVEIAEWIRANASREIDFDMIKNKGLVDLLNRRGTAHLCAGLNEIPYVAMVRAKDIISILNNLEFRITDGRYMFYNAFLTEAEAPLFDTSLIQNAECMFLGCKGLTIVPSYNFRYVTNTSLMFNDCLALTEIWIKNIRTNLQIGSGTSYGHLLTVESLVHLIYELRDVYTGYVKTLTVGSANLEKLANVYVKTIDVTEEMRAEDEFVDEKLPFVVCESTDPDAILITEYVGAKNWALK